jgi:hypothetical protein
LRKITFTNSNGDSITFKNEYGLISFEGLGGIEASSQLQKSPHQDGSTRTDVTLDEANPSIEFIIKGSSSVDVAEKRKYLSKVFNPKLPLGVLRYEDGEDIKEKRAIATSSPIFPEGDSNKGEKFQKGIINMLAPEPFWEDISTNTKPLLAFEPRFQFPFKFSPTVEFGGMGDKATVDNQGHDEAPIEIQIIGYVKNPKILNKTTGEHILINREIAIGEKLIITTCFNNRKVLKINNDGTTSNVIHWMDLSSTFFQLQIGINEIEYSADAGEDQSNVTISWRNRYVGI